MSRKNRRDWTRFTKGKSKSFLEMLFSAQKLMNNIPLGKSGRNPRVKVVVNEVIAKTAGGHHAWIDTNVGIIRKPLGTF